MLGLVVGDQDGAGAVPGPVLPGHDGDAGHVGGDGAGRVEGGGVQVAEGHGGGLGVVDPVADPAGKLGAQRGDAGAEVGADPLPADNQVDPESAAQLG